jgi:hypothetical protein
MARGSSALSGTVTGADGAPVAGARLSAREQQRDAEGTATATSDEKGHFRLEGLTQGRPYRLTVEAPDGRRTDRKVTLREREQTEDIALPEGGPDMESHDTSPSNAQVGDDEPAGGAGGGAAEPAAAGGGVAAERAAAGGGGGNGKGGDEDAAEFDRLVTLLEDPRFAPEPPVNIDEANELARLFVVAMQQLARVPEAIERLNTELTGPNPRAGDLTLENTAAIPTAVTDSMTAVILKTKEDANTQDQLMREIRRAFNLGTGNVSPVNAEFGRLYRNLVTLAADDRSGVDPDRVEQDDPAQAAVIYNYLRDLKRAILELVQNASVYGSGGTRLLVKKWSKIMADSDEVLDTIAQHHVSSQDSDDKAPWSLLAGLTDTPRGTVKAYVVNARHGGQLLRLAIGIYHSVQQSAGGQNGGGVQASGIDDEDRAFLRRLFFAKGNTVLESPLKEKVGETLVADELSKHARLVRDYVAPLWP